MNRKTRALVIGAAAVLGLMSSTLASAADPAPAAKPVSTSNKWRLEFDGRADTDGEIIFAIVAPDATTNITTKVAKGDSENKVAKHVRDALRTQAPVKKYKFETDDGEDVLLKRVSRVPDFGLQLVSSSVTGLDIRIRKE